MNTGVTTDDFTVTVCVAVLEPLQPVAVAVITVVPIHAASYVTAPVEPSIVLLPARLAASKLYIMPVLLLADAV